jgi:hypothetical protein
LDANERKRVATRPRWPTLCVPYPLGTRFGNKNVMSPNHATSVAQVIQLAVAPVFLLAGVGATLNVLATRIGRIIDRARMMEAQLPSATAELAEDLHARLRVLSKRASLINRAIALCVLCGLLVSLVVAALFVASALQLELALPIAIVFVVALLSLALALIYFLREVFIATASLSFGGVRPTKLLK